MIHDHLCDEDSPFLHTCLGCELVRNVRDDEHYRIIERLQAMPPDTTRDQVIQAITPGREGWGPHVPVTDVG